MVFYVKGNPFPDPSIADPNGLLAIGGDLSPETLIRAYNQGIFPWYNPNEPILWWSPDPRLVLFPNTMKVSKSLRKTIRNQKFTVTFNRAFQDVIKACASVLRKDQKGTWISPEMQEAYIKLHQQGYAMSVETWNENRLVGGLYGIDLADKKVFCGESMFHLETDASKIALFYLVGMLKMKNYKLIDCQVYTEHLASLGAEEISRKRFLSYLK